MLVNLLIIAVIAIIAIKEFDTFKTALNYDYEIDEEEKNVR